MAGCRCGEKPCECSRWLAAWPCRRSQAERKLLTVLDSIRSCSSTIFLNLCSDDAARKHALYPQKGQHQQLRGQLRRRIGAEGKQWAGGGDLDEVVVDIPGDRALQLAVDVMPRLPWPCTPTSTTPQQLTSGPTMGTCQANYKVSLYSAANLASAASAYQPSWPVQCTAHQDQQQLICSSGYKCSTCSVIISCLLWRSAIKSCGWHTASIAC